MNKKEYNTAQPETPVKISRDAQELAFEKSLRQARTHMNVFERTFSRFMHVKLVEKVSDFIGGTLARPNAILFGSLFALLLTVATYSTAKFFGYSLSGSESIASFGIGWIIGITIDYTHVLISGGQTDSRR